jgi:hypothetical protein
MIETTQTQPHPPNMPMSAESAIMFGAPVLMFTMLLAGVVTIVCRYHNYKGKAQIRLWRENMGFEIILDSQEDKNPNSPNLKPLDATQPQNSVEVLPESPDQIHSIGDR